MKKTILLSLAVTSLVLSGYSQEKKSKFGSLLEKGADAVKKEVNNTGSSETTTGSGTTGGTTTGGAATTGPKSGVASATIAGGTNSTPPECWTCPRPMNPVITNKKSRIYGPDAGQFMFTEFDAPSSELHKANIDKIVFGNARINKDGNASQLKTSFKPGEAIYGRAFMKTCMMNYKVYMTNVTAEASKNMEGHFDVNYTIDNKIFGTLMSSQLSNAGEKWSTFTIVTIGTGEDAEQNNEDFIKELNALPPGNHTVKLVVWSWQGDFISVDPVAIGEFTFVKDAGAKAMGVGRNFGGVKAGMEDAALQDKCLKKMIAHAKSQGWSETFNQVKIIDEDWSTIRHPKTGIVTGRIINIAAKAKWPDGHCTYQEFSMIQDHDGAAYMNAVNVYGVGSQTTIDCE